MQSKEWWTIFEIFHIYWNSFHEQGAVTTNGQECAQIGADILAKNGSAVDAAIGALLCEGVASLHRYCIIFSTFIVFISFIYFNKILLILYISFANKKIYLLNISVYTFWFKVRDWVVDFLWRYGMRKIKGRIIWMRERPLQWQRRRICSMAMLI